MKDITLDSFSHDVVILAGDLRIADNIPQHIKQRLLTILGEWFLDLSIGLPWFDEILGKHQDLSQVEALIKTCITETPGVSELVSFSVEGSETQERTANIQFSVRLTDGSTNAITLEV